MRKKKLLQFCKEKIIEYLRMKEMTNPPLTKEKVDENVMRNCELNGRIRAYQEMLDYLSV